MSKYLKIIETSTDRKEIGHAIEKIMIEQKITNTKLANILGCRKSGVPYKLTHGVFLLSEINKLRESGIL